MNAELCLVRAIAALAPLASADEDRPKIGAVLVEGGKSHVTVAATNGQFLGFVSLLTPAFDGLRGAIPRAWAMGVARAWSPPEWMCSYDDETADVWSVKPEVNDWASVVCELVKPGDKHIAWEDLYRVMPKPSALASTDSWFGSEVVAPVLHALRVLGAPSFRWSGQKLTEAVRLDTAPDFGSDDWWPMRRTASFCVMPRREP